MYAGGGHKDFCPFEELRYMASSILHAFCFGEDHSYFRIIAKRHRTYFTYSHFKECLLFISLSINNFVWRTGEDCKTAPEAQTAIYDMCGK
jgi:hypothetical protein